MLFRLGFALGLVAGYVLGAKAGRERYEQIQSLWGSVKSSDAAQQLSSEVSGAASKAGKAVEEKATESVNKVSKMVRNTADEEA